MRTHTTARPELDRETYAPCTSEELPSLAVKAAMIAALSDLVAGRAELVASAAVADVNTIITASIDAGKRERNVTRSILNVSGRA